MKLAPSEKLLLTELRSLRRSWPVFKCVVQINRDVLYLCDAEFRKQLVSEPLEEGDIGDPSTIEKVKRIETDYIG